MKNYIRATKTSNSHGMALRSYLFMFHNSKLGQRINNDMHVTRHKMSAEAIYISFLSWQNSSINHWNRRTELSRVTFKAEGAIGQVSSIWQYTGQWWTVYRSVMDSRDGPRSLSWQIAPLSAVDLSVFIIIYTYRQHMCRGDHAGIYVRFCSTQ